MLTIRNLKVAHRARFAQEQPEFDPRQVFSLNTCQRSLWVYWSNAENYDDSHAGTLPHFPGIDHFSGEQAYEFLLAVACGLESRILGETNIFGQLKEAWERFSSERDPHADPALTHLFHKLFEDTKDIRSQYLRHAGGDSYGSLVRRFMKEHSAAAGPILLLGAGDIARTVAPGLLENELWILNRDRSRALSLSEELHATAGQQARIRILDKSDEADAFSRAAHLVVCIPFDQQTGEDLRRVNLWNRTEKSANSLVIHLAGPREQAGAWLSLLKFHCLDDLFAFQESHGKIRKVQILRARKACADRAKLRAFGSSLSIAHGWEYLAAFG